MPENAVLKPDTLWWLITGHCNLHCRHCYIRAPQRQYRQIATAEAEYIIDEAVRFGIKKFFITGGEPFMRRDALQLFARIYAKGGRIVCIESNGLLMDAEIIGFLKSHAIAVTVSHDGSSFTAANRGIDDEHKLTEVIMELVRQGVQTTINTALNAENTACAVSLFDTLKECKIYAWNLFGPFYYGRYNDEFAPLPAQAEADVYKTVYTKWLRAGKPFHIKLGNTFDSTFPDTRWRHYACEHAMKTITLFPDGRAIPCCRYIAHPDYSNCPNILDGGMEKILSDTTLLKYKHLKMDDIIRQNPECANCGLLWKCNAGCRMDAFLAGGNILGKDPRNCFIMKDTSKYYETVGERN